MKKPVKEALRHVSQMKQSGKKTNRDKTKTMVMDSLQDKAGTKLNSKRNGKENISHAHRGTFRDEDNTWNRGKPGNVDNNESNITYSQTERK